MSRHIKLSQLLLVLHSNQVSEVVVTFDLIFLSVVDSLVHEVSEEVCDLLGNHSDFEEFYEEWEQSVKNEDESDERRKLHDFPSHLADFRLFFRERLRISCENAA